LLVVAAALALGITATAYSTAKVNSNAQLVLVGEGIQGQLAVETFAVEIAPMEAVTLAEEELLAGDDPQLMGLTAGLLSAPLVDAQVVCGQVTNNLGVPLTSLVVHGAIGVSVKDIYSLEPGETTDLYCDGSLLEPGFHELSGVLTAEWAKGRAEIAFTVEVTVLEPEEEETELEELEDEGLPDGEEVENEDDGATGDLGDDDQASEESGPGAPTPGSGGGSGRPKTGGSGGDDTGDEGNGNDDPGDEGDDAGDAGEAGSDGDDPAKVVPGNDDLGDDDNDDAGDPGPGDAGDGDSGNAGGAGDGGQGDTPAGDAGPQE